MASSSPPAAALQAQPLSPPLSPPLPQHLHIVALETHSTPMPAFALPEPHTFTLTTYERTTTSAEVVERISDADIVITTVSPLGARELAVAPRLRLIAVMASGTDTIALGACAARGIRVLNSAHCNTTSLAEHVTGMYLAVRRSLLPVHGAMAAGEWTRRHSLMTMLFQEGAPPRSCADETAVLIGYGGVGQSVGRLLGLLGMRVVVAGRRGEAAAKGRVAWEEALRQATVLVVCCPRTPKTLDLIGAAELALLPRDAIVVNVSRGNIVNEQALVEALRAGRLAGAGVDVFEHEPADAHNSPLVAAAAQGGLNLVLSAHTAWISASTRVNYQWATKENVEHFVQGFVNPERVRA